MKKKLVILGIISVAIAITAVTMLYTADVGKSKPIDFEWISSGPFSVQGYQHRLGENIFVVADGIAPYEKGTIRVFTPKNLEYVSYPFDGSSKSSFNVYFKPDTQPKKNRCSPEDIIGIWTMKFEGVDYPPIQFEFINEYIEGGEADIINLCKEDTT